MQTNNGGTAAIEAAGYGEEATLKILVDAKADLDAKVRREGGEMLGEDGGGGLGGRGCSVDVVTLVLGDEIRCLLHS